MPFQQIYCSQEGCRWHTEVKGGHFHYSRERHGFYCDDCFGAPPLTLNDCADRWHFTTRHLNGHPIEVKSLNHLRLLEKQYGVSNQAANNMQAHWNDAPSVRPQPMNPELERFLGKAREMPQFGRSEVRGGWNETHR